MKLQTSLLAIAALALLMNDVDARRNRKASKWAQQRVQNVRNDLERVYGKGLVGMMNPKTGKLDFDRMGADNKVTGSDRMGAQLNIQIGDQILDATKASATFLGFAKGLQYTGLNRASSGSLPIDDAQLTNCFASTYALINTIDIAAYNIKNIVPASGTFKGFDVLVMDPIAIFADSMVNFEMCEYASIIDQAKDMAGLDFASLSDNFTREVLVGAFDFKPAFKEIKSLQKQATDCIDAKKLYSKLQEADLKEEGEDQWDAFGDDNQGDEWNVFRTLTDMKALENEAMNCVDKPDRFTIGEIGGKLFASMFDNALQPLI